LSPQGTRSNIVHVFSEQWERGVLEQVLAFWFTETTPRQWWKVDAAFDTAVRERFSGLHHAAHLGELWKWRQTPRGRLAEIIVLDQFSRNMFRGTARAFASDAMALALAQEAVAGGHDMKLDPKLRAFVYMPYQHSESRRVQEESVHLFKLLGAAEQYDFALRHKAIIDRFGRYPHRNEILGRESTPEEHEFLQQPGSSF
jgi:uncharacterized protein (DUF924 family)